MYSLEKIKQSIVQAINQKLDKEVVQLSDLVYPPDLKMGDLSLPCFSLAKALGQNPAEIARDLMSKIGSEVKAISAISTAGPYLNFRVKKDYLAENVLKEIGKGGENYGQNENGQGKRTMVEFTNVNTHKQYHVGHVRNLCFGASLSNILSANGYQVFPVSYINDFGIHTAKTLWALQEYYKDAAVPENRGEFLGQVYVKAAQEEKTHPLAKGMIELIMKKIEAREGEEYKKWQETREWSIEQLDRIYEKMGIKLVHIFYESEYIDQGRQIVEKLLKDGILRISDGAVIADLEQFGLAIQVVRRSDGTSTYIVADLALAKEKFDKYDLDTSIYITDNRQILHFRQFFKLLSLMGYEQKLVHLPHEFVKLKSGMMASRTGNIVTFEALYDEIEQKFQAEIKARHSAWPEQKIVTAAKKLSVGAIKFEMLKLGADQTITFELEKAMSFQGYSAAYLQYTFARIQSIVRKAGIENKELGIKNPFDLIQEKQETRVEFGNLLDDKESGLLMMMAKYPEAVVRAAEKFDPSEIAKYLFDLAQIFNDYYHAVPILKADEAVKRSRLLLVAGVSQVLENGLKLLGIEVLDEM